MTAAAWCVGRSLTSGYEPTGDNASQMLITAKIPPLSDMSPRRETGSRGITYCYRRAHLSRYNEDPLEMLCALRLRRAVLVVGV